MISMPGNKLDNFAMYRYARLLQEQNKLEKTVKTSSIENFIEMHNKFLDSHEWANDPALKDIVSDIKKASEKAAERDVDRVNTVNNSTVIFFQDAINAASEDLSRNGIFLKDRMFRVTTPKGVSIEDIQSIIDSNAKNNNSLEALHGPLNGGDYVAFPSRYENQEEAYKVAKALIDEYGAKVYVGNNDDGFFDREITGLIDDNKDLYAARKGKPIRESIFSRSKLIFDHGNDHDVDYMMANGDIYGEIALEEATLEAFIANNKDEYEGIYQKWIESSKEIEPGLDL